MPLYWPQGFACNQKEVVGNKSLVVHRLRGPLERKGRAVNVTESILFFGKKYFPKKD